MSLIHVEPDFCGRISYRMWDLFEIVKAVSVQTPLFNMERKRADTINTVLILWAGHFQC